MIIELCGKCLHAKTSHEPHNGHFMYCAKCMSLCDLQEFNIKHEPSGMICQDGVRIICKAD